MSILAGHRWEYQPDYREYKCVELPIGGVESHQWCVGCGVKITDKALCEKGITTEDECFLQCSLDLLAYMKGYSPIESGSLAEWKLKK